MSDTSFPAIQSYDPIAERLLFSQILGVTFLQKLAIPVGGGTQIFFGLALMLSTVVYGVLSGRLVIRPALMAAYLVMIAVMALTQLLNGAEFSILSLTLLILISSPYIFRLKVGAARENIALVFFQKIVFVLCILGIMQFFLQFIIGTSLTFFLDGDGLKNIMMQNFNSTNPLTYGSHYFKPNAIVLLEPAMLSKFAALSIIIEAIYFKRLTRLALLLFTLVLTFSGTGLIVLFLLAPFYLLQKRQFALLAVLILAVSTAGLWAPAVGLGRTVDRMAEFTIPGTSGYARFVSIFPILRDHVFTDTTSTLVGQGAGTSKTMSRHYTYEVHPPSWGKLWIEYGVIGLLSYLLLLLPAIWSSRPSRYLCMALTVMLFYDDYVLIPTMHGLIIALLAWPTAGRFEAAKGEGYHETRFSSPA